MSPSYYNRMPLQLQAELEAASRVGLTPVEIPSREFDSLASEGLPMIYVVVGGRLLVAKRQVRGEHISHAVLADGGPVQAAGEFEIGTERGSLVMSTLNNLSGHYRPSKASLEVARTAFESVGIHIPLRAVRGYDLGTS